METIEVTMWVLIDGDGDYVVAKDRENLAERYAEDFTELNSEVTTRYVKVTVRVPKPKPVELVATVGDEPAAGELKVA